MEQRRGHYQYQLEQARLSPQVERRKSQRKIVQYELDFDLQKAKALQEVKLTSPERYTEEEQAFEGFIRMQLLTALGERYNRGMSEFSYRVKEGKLVGEHSDEPFEDILERGRAYREMHGDPVDHPREKAEVVGFQKMQAVMADGETPAGTVMLTISPPGGEGSIYKHNFYDGYRKNDDGSIQAVRFSSALTPEETIMRLWEIDPSVETPEDTSDVTLLSQPILLSQAVTLEELHHALHKNHEMLSEEDWARVQEVSEILITCYIATLKKEPTNQQRVKEVYNALLNRADDVVDALRQGRYEQQFSQKQRDSLSSHDFYALAYRPVRSVTTGCGFSGGAELGGGLGSSSALGAFGVGDFGSGRPEDDPNLCRCEGAAAHFHCPGTTVEKEQDEDGNEVKKEVSCNYKITVGKGITMCPNCGESKKC